MATKKSVVFIASTVLLGLAVGRLIQQARPQELASVATPTQSVQASQAPRDNLRPVSLPSLPPLSNEALADIGKDTAQVVQSQRADGAWKGMPVDMAMRPTCGSTSDCSESLACWDDGMCGPCRSDSECMSGETCVLEHCVADEVAACSSNEQCEDERVCILERTETRSARLGPALASACLSKAGGFDDSPSPASADGESEAREVATRPPGDYSDPDRLLGLLRETADE